jgi:arylsulfatase A-like enzyme
MYRILLLVFTQGDAMAQHPTRRAFMKALGLTGTTLSLNSLSSAQSTLLKGKPQSRKNVLFIAVDDLRPELGCYGQGHMKTPNMDRLASRGLVFNRAYCQWAVCGPSRASLLSGLRPDSSNIHYIGQSLTEMVPAIQTLPGIFNQNGYHTASLGKIYHGKGDDWKSWTEKPWRADDYGRNNWEGYMTPEAEAIQAVVW